jgi:hypothetical protein
MWFFMKYFFILLFVSNVFSIYTMDNARAKIVKPRRQQSKYQRIEINRNNNISRKWAYICTICKKPTIDISRHMRYHTGVRPYECIICSLSFVESGTCIHHIRTIHPELENISYIIKFPGKEPYTRMVAAVKQKKDKPKSIQFPINSHQREKLDNTTEDIQIEHFIEQQNWDSIDEILNEQITQESDSH